MKLYIADLSEIKVENDNITYFKFGNYVLSQAPVTRKDWATRADSESCTDCYDDLGITKSRITFTDVSYSSNH